MHNREQSYEKGIFLIFLATLGWSLSGLFVRFMPELDGWQINCWRGYWTGITLLTYLLIVYGWGTFQKFREIPLAALIMSALFFAVGSTSYVTSLTMVSTATVAVIGATSPLFAALLSPWVTGEPPGLEAWIAALLGVLGVGIIAWDGLNDGLGLGLLVCLGAPILFASQTLALRRYRRFDMVPAICVGGFLSFFLAGFFGFMAGHNGGGFDVAFRDVMLLAAMAVVQLAIPLILYTRGAFSVPAVTLTLVAMLDAVINPLWPWLVVGEQPGWAAFAGGAVIICAVLISIFGMKVRQYRLAALQSAEA